MLIGINMETRLKAYYYNNNQLNSLILIQFVRNKEKIYFKLDI